MFLDEKLLEIGRAAKLDQDGITKSVSAMLDECLNNLQANLTETSSPEEFKATFRRVNRTWELVAKKLDQEGRGFIREDGFRLTICREPKLAELL